MPGDQFITGLDIGSYLIKASAITGKNGDIIFSCHGYTEGVSKNKITEPTRFANSVRSVLRQLEIKTGNPVDKIFLSIDSDFVRAHMNKGFTQIANGNVDNQDIYKALLNSMLITKENDEDIVDLLVSEYLIDDMSFSNPKGVKGKKLEVTSQVVLAERQNLNDINKALNKENVFLAGTSLAVHGMANMLLSKKQRKDGVLLVDTGHSKTELVVYKDNKVVYQDTVPLGGKNITKDLSIVLKITMNDAEDLKVQFGKGNLDKSFPKYNLIEEVIQARTAEILGYVRLLFTKYKDYKDINEAYVYGGGLCGIKNISKYCKDTLKISTNFLTSDIIKSDDVFTLNATGCAYNIIHEIQSDLIVKRFYDKNKINVKIDSTENVNTNTNTNTNRNYKSDETKFENTKVESEESNQDEDYFSIFDKVKKNSLNKIQSDKKNEKKPSLFKEKFEKEKIEQVKVSDTYGQVEDIKESELVEEIEEIEEVTVSNNEPENKLKNKIKKLFGIE